ncbi:putative lipoprotein [Hyphomonas neptunium ATCC 15444]|uniref:Putative lipoprotein n=2 Tax=Hyphomonas TaxID=85 RepID=Q0C4E9_HYPNA|nr:MULTISPECIES: beta-propeller domain-containing protein [Hyphomonas]ABI76325.1 putative lipoprotein [Hyphomonas neptunium ATCC 15444]KCZ96394.1 putative lipoprotein [Hyphomonas hirschiana VP5]
MIRFFGLPLIALVACACTYSQPTALVPDVPEPPAPLENRFDGYAVPEQDESLAVFEDPALEGLRSPALSRFRTEAEFADWLKATRAASEARGIGQMYPVPLPAAPPSSDMAMSVGEPQAMEAAPSEVMVTGSAEPESDSNPEITNNQKAGVDEGGIIKQIGQHLVILQDGRLFVTDLMPGGQAGLKLADRANVYRSSDEDTWYDEVLVSGRTILVTGYSYREEATEYTVLNLGEDGKVTRQATFYISSNDYYSGSNYATRMIDGKLVIHTPIYLVGRGWWDDLEIPVIREWRQEEEDGFRERTELEDGRPLFSATDIWMPVQQTLMPVIHTVTVCDISGVTDTSIPACKATAIVGTETHEFLVTKDAFWLWMSPSGQERARELREDHPHPECSSGPRPELSNIVPSALVRLPVDGSKPGVLGVRGEPQNQFSMDMDAGTFRAVLDWRHRDCGIWVTREETDLTFFDVPLDELGDVLLDTAGGRYFDLPTPGASAYEARFTEKHLVYGAREGWGSWPPSDGETRENGRAIIVPVDAPASPVTVELSHDVIRAERAGPYMALTGYHDDAGLSMSLIDLRADPRLSGTMTLQGRYESETRSHAFNSRIGADGAGLIGLPTVPRSEEAERWWWWSSSSDMSYIAAAADGSLSEAGMIDATRRDPDLPSETGYACEVSCIDWYGNARPIFTGNRLLALINSELVEGALQDGTVTEINRIDLTAPLSEER